LKVRKYEIYDRWGNKVFGAYNYDPKQLELGWDGTLNGQVVNPGVFVYLIEAWSVNGSLVYKKGDLKLIRKNVKPSFFFNWLIIRVLY